MAGVYHVLQLCYYIRIFKTKKILLNIAVFVTFFPGNIFILACNMITDLFKIRNADIFRARGVAKYSHLTPQ
jgi:peroxiredoxin family protein